MPQEHERALKGAQSSFVIPGVAKADINSYVAQVKSHIPFKGTNIWMKRN